MRILPEPRKKAEGVSTASASPAHEADRHIEHAHSLLQVISCLAASADDQEWQDARNGLCIISEQIDQHMISARAALDDA